MFSAALLDDPRGRVDRVPFDVGGPLLVDPVLALGQQALSVLNRGKVWGVGAWIVDHFVRDSWRHI